MSSPDCTRQHSSIVVDGADRAPSRAMLRAVGFTDADFPKTSWRLRRFLWAPALGCTGIQRIHVLKDVVVLAGAGVGGGGWSGGGSSSDSGGFSSGGGGDFGGGGASGDW